MPQASPLFRPSLIWAVLLLGAGIALQVFPSAAESSRSIPPPALDEPANPKCSAHCRATCRINLDERSFVSD